VSRNLFIECFPNIWAEPCDVIRHFVYEYSAVRFFNAFELTNSATHKRSGIVFVHAIGHAQLEKEKRSLHGTGTALPTVDKGKYKCPLSWAVFGERFKRSAGLAVAGLGRFKRRGWM
jgi:hypothetical protein